MSVAELFTPEWAQEVAQAMAEGPSDEYKARVLDVYWMWIDMVRADFDGELALGGQRLPGAAGPESYLILSFAKGECTGARLAGLGYSAAGFSSGSGASFVGAQHAAPHLDSGPHFVHGMPLDEQIQRQISATDPTSRAIHSQRLEGEAKKFFRPKHLPRRRW